MKHSVVGCLSPPCLPLLPWQQKVSTSALSSCRAGTSALSSCSSACRGETFKEERGDKDEKGEEGWERQAWKQEVMWFCFVLDGETVRQSYQSCGQLMHLLIYGQLFSLITWLLPKHNFLLSPNQGECFLDEASVSLHPAHLPCQ